MPLTLTAPFWLPEGTSAWVLALATAALVAVLLRAGNGSIVRRLSATAPQTPSVVDDLLLDMLRRTTLPFQLAIGLYTGAQWVDLSARAASQLRHLTVLVLLWQVGRWLVGMVRNTMVLVVDQRLNPDDQSQRSGRNLLQSLAVGLVWSVVGLLALQNVGIEINSLVAGLGVTTAIVGLAGQQIGSDILASASILLDKSFLVGDFIIVDQFLGTIERIGVIKTQIRSLSGEVISFSNNDLLKSRVRNYRTLAARRVLFDFLIASSTPLRQVETLQQAIRSTIERTPHAKFDRAHFVGFATHGLRIEVVYFVQSGDYNVYMDVQQAINLDIMRHLEQHNVQLAVGLAVRSLAGHRIVGDVPPMLGASTAAAAPSLHSS